MLDEVQLIIAAHDTQLMIMIDDLFDTMDANEYIMIDFIPW